MATKIWKKYPSFPLTFTKTSMQNCKIVSCFCGLLRKQAWTFCTYFNFLPIINLTFFKFQVSNEQLIPDASIPITFTKDNRVHIGQKIEMRVVTLGIVIYSKYNKHSNEPSFTVFGPIEPLGHYWKFLQYC